MAPLTLRAATAADGPGVRALFAATHKRELSDDLWRWRYHGRPDSPSICTVADDGGVIAQIGALIFPAGALTLALWTDLMTHPDRRDLGLFMDLAQANLDACRSAGVGLVYAFPNDRSYPLLKRLFGFSDLGDITAYEAPLKALALRDAPPATQTRPDSAELDALWKRSAPIDALTLRRDAAWVDWRFHRRPGAPYAVFYSRVGGHLSGWAAVKVFDGPTGRVGDIVELWGDSPEALASLTATMLRWFVAQGADVVSAWAGPSSSQAGHYGEMGLKPVGPRTHFVAKALAPVGEPFTGGAGYWRIGKGDSDVF